MSNRSLERLTQWRDAGPRAFTWGHHMGQSATPSEKPSAWRHAYSLGGLALVLLASCLVLCVGALAFASSGSGWVNQTSGTTASLSGVCFVDASHGWVVGGSGAILVTANGGATWTAQSSGMTKSLNDVSFSDASHGWVVGEDGTILVTSNGGVT